MLHVLHCRSWVLCCNGGVCIPSLSGLRSSLGNSSRLAAQHGVRCVCDAVDGTAMILCKYRSDINEILSFSQLLELYLESRAEDLVVKAALPNVLSAKKIKSRSSIMVAKWKKLIDSRVASYPIWMGGRRYPHCDIGTSMQYCTDDVLAGASAECSTDRTGPPMCSGH